MTEKVYIVILYDEDRKKKDVTTIKKAFKNFKDAEQYVKRKLSKTRDDIDTLEDSYIYKDNICPYSKMYSFAEYYIQEMELY